MWKRADRQIFRDDRQEGKMEKQAGRYTVKYSMKTDRQTRRTILKVKVNGGDRYLKIEER